MNNTQLSALPDFLHALGQQTHNRLHTDTYTRTLYSTDASIYQIMPHAVLIPQHIDEVQAAVALAAQYKIPLLPRTGGSSLAGQATNAAVVIDFTTHLDKILDFNPEAKTVRVQPGLVLDHLNHALRPHRLQFGPDPASSNRAAMGGIISNNSTGSHSIRYGMTADHLHAVSLLLDDASTAQFTYCDPDTLGHKQKLTSREGQIYHQINTLTQNQTNQDIIRAGTPRHWRRCGGYNLDRFVDGPSFHYPQDHRFNLAKLICGAEGTLGIITDLTLNLVPTPDYTALAIIEFNDLPTALNAVPAILETNPSAVELLDNLGLTNCRQVPQYARLLDTFLQGQPYCVLITEFYGDNPAHLQAQIDNLRQHLHRQALGAQAITPLLDPQAQQNVWRVRKVALGFLMSIKGDYKPVPFIEDAAVPVEHLAAYIAKLEAFCHDLGTQVAYYAHASAGCIHIRPLMNTKKAEELAKLTAIADFSVDLLHGYGGSLSSEHGDGKARSWLNPRFFGPDLYHLYQQVKQIFDPHNIFNPGHIVNAPAMTDNLRYGPSYDVIPLTTHLDFSPNDGFHRAVEQCNGAGICRKRLTGTMCPSFMATRNEEDSTRGRANALRAAFSGRLPAEELTSPRMYQVMDLCVSCKACQAECPSSVDMAKIKTEFLAQYYAEHGTPLRARLFSQIDRANRLFSGPLAPLANTLATSPPARALLTRLGLTPDRPLPAFSRAPFPAWFAQHQQPNHSRPVLLAVDSYNAYNHPHIPITAVRLLNRAGYHVRTIPLTDYGRPAFSKGLITDARHAATQIMAHLAPFAHSHIPILFLEPSDLSMIHDDYASLIPHHPDLAAVKAVSQSIEEFLLGEIDNGRCSLPLTTTPRQLILHGHCHQKALFGTAATRTLLTQPANYTLTELDTSCCGMAGSFGYEAEHLTISQAMGERRLAPTIRNTPPDTLLVAPGTSCREQIHHLTGRAAYHPIQILWQALQEED
ncbi:MAG TPA: FAD-linked oxidase C-terminal domain-containing protein [Anaerolineae bacterium]|nr:FAD-linked oxidase C-terminal domain-containing protein [Anaerolineae bacterium]